jgi:protein SCO1/2
VDKVQAVFVTVDPERDTPEVVGAYVAGFGPDFVGLRGSLEQTQAAAKEFKVFFAKVPGKADGSYTIDHTAGSFVFDPQGRVRLFIRHGGGAEAMGGDLKLLLGGA